MPSSPPRLASGWSGLKYPKGPTRAELKGSLTYRERQIIDRNRAHCERRDGFCRIGHWKDSAIALFGECYGPSEWNHFRRRSKSRGEAPEVRHSTEITGMLCERHHDMVDEHEIDFDYLTNKRADGPMKFRNDIGELVEHEMPKPHWDR
jgi:hypothetical protein